MKVVFGSGGYVINAAENPAAQFAPDYAALFVDAPGNPPAGMGVGWRYAGGNWSPPGPPPPVSLEDRKAAKLAALAAKRWEVETGGVTVEGSVIRTDAVSQAKLTGAVTLAQSDQTLNSIDWEAQPGVWVTLDPPTIVAMGVTVGRFVQACFSRAKVLSQAITAAADQAALDAIDINTGWPS